MKIVLLLVCILIIIVDVYPFKSCKEIVESCSYVDNSKPIYGLNLIANCVNASYAQIMWSQTDLEVELISLYYNCSSPTNDSLLLFDILDGHSHDQSTNGKSNFAIPEGMTCTFSACVQYDICWYYNNRSVTCPFFSDVTPSTSLSLLTSSSLYSNFKTPFSTSLLQSLSDQTSIVSIHTTTATVTAAITTTTVIGPTSTSNSSNQTIIAVIITTFVIVLIIGILVIFLFMMCLLFQNRIKRSRRASIEYRYQINFNNEFLNIHKLDEISISGSMVTIEESLEISTGTKIINTSCLNEKNLITDSNFRETSDFDDKNSKAITNTSPSEKPHLMKTINPLSSVNSDLVCSSEYNDDLIVSPDSDTKTLAMSESLDIDLDKVETSETHSRDKETDMLSSKPHSNNPSFKHANENFDSSPLSATNSQPCHPVKVSVNNDSPSMSYIPTTASSSSDYSSDVPNYVSTNDYIDREHNQPLDGNESIIDMLYAIDEIDETEQNDQVITTNSSDSCIISLQTKTQTDNDEKQSSLLNPVNSTITDDYIQYKHSPSPNDTTTFCYITSPTNDQLHNNCINTPTLSTSSYIDFANKVKSTDLSDDTHFPPFIATDEASLYDVSSGEGYIESSSCYSSNNICLQPNSHNITDHIKHTCHPVATCNGYITRN